jgi:hypothetical protein
MVTLWMLGGCTLGAGNPNIVRGSGRVVTEPRQVSGVDEVVLTISGELSIVQDGSESLTIEGEDNIVPLITTQVTGKRLLIGVADNASFSNTRPLRYFLSVHDLSFVASSGSGNIQVAEVKGDELQTETSGSGAIAVANASVNSYRAEISGSGDIIAAGSTGSQRVKSTASGSFNGGDLQSKSAVVELFGSGDAFVNVSDTLDASVSGSGSIRYKGSPIVTEHDSGSGKIEQVASDQR